MVTPAPEHQVVTRPRVPISKKNTTTYIARCHHCEWAFTETIRAAVEEQARYHRHQHRTGQLPVTP